MRLTAYVGASSALAGGVILKALHQRPNFYSACVYLSQSSANLMILTNLCLMVVGFCVFALQRLLYGRLRAVETEQLYERAWFAVTETCLAMTIFRGEMGGWFLVMFVCLLIGKLWGWIGQGRLEILEQQPPSNPRLFHTRLAVSLVLSVMFNAFLLEYSVQTVLRQARPDMMVMFGFEFAVLTILSASTAARYGISLVEIYLVAQQKRIKMAERRQELRAAREEASRQRESSGQDRNPAGDGPEDEIDETELDVPGWEEKGRWVFYLDLITDFLKLMVYLSFFAILFTFYGLPIHILRDVVLTMKSFVKRILQFLRYRNATRDMNERYPDATAEEIASEDVCIICREEMHPWQQPGAAADGQTPRVISERLRPKKLPCGHLLHFACLRSWLERQQICPTCRRPVTTAGGTGQRGQQPGGGPDAGGAAPGQQQMPGPNQADAGNAQAGGEGRPRAWFLNLGPIRIGFGAGRGDIVRNLVQQMQNGQPDGAGHAGGAPAPEANVNAPPADAPPQQQQQQPLGFGFGFGRRAAAAPQFSHQNIQQQIQQLERQMIQEIDGLNATADQLDVVRLLQRELARLRAAQRNPNPNPNPNPTPTPTQPAINRGEGPAPPAAIVPQPPQLLPARAVSTGQRQPMVMVGPGPGPAIGAGDARLPEGLSLPSGWTLQPLQRLQRQPGQQQADHQPPRAATSNVNASTPSQGAQSGPNLMSSSFVPSQFVVGPNGHSQAATSIEGHAAAPVVPSTASDENPQRATPSTTLPASSSSATNEEGTSGQATQSASKDASAQQGSDYAERSDSVLSNGSPHQDAEYAQDADQDGPSSSSKGKGRAATVEDVEGE